MRSHLKLQGLLATVLLVGGLGSSCSGSSQFAVAPEASQVVSTVTNESVSLLMDTDTVTLETPITGVRARQIRIEVQAPDFEVEEFTIQGATFTRDNASSRPVTRYSPDTFRDGRVRLEDLTTFTLPGIDHTCVTITDRVGRVLSESTACGGAPDPTPPPTPEPNPNPQVNGDVEFGDRPECLDLSLPPASNLISINDVTEFEGLNPIGNPPRTPFEFTITLNRRIDPATGQPFGGTVFVDVQTRDDLAGASSATVPDDYDPIPALEADPNDPLPFVRFEPDGNSIQERTVIVNVVPDIVLEGNERFGVELTNPCNADINTPIGLGTIVNGGGDQGNFNVFYGSPQTFIELDELSTLRPTISGGTAPFTFDLIETPQLNNIFDTPNVPPQFDAGIGVLSGTPNLDPNRGTGIAPNADAFVQVVVDVTDAAGLRGQGRFELVIRSNNPELSLDGVSPVSFVQFEPGESDAPSIVDETGDPPFVFSGGLDLDNDGQFDESLGDIGLSIAPGTGVISGTPIQAGSFLAQIRVTDFDGDFDEGIVAIEIAPAGDLGFLTPNPAVVTFGAGTNPGSTQVVTLTPSVPPQGGVLVVDVAPQLTGATVVSPAGPLTFPAGSIAPQTIVIQRSAPVEQPGGGFISVTQNAGATTALNFPDGSVNLSIPVAVEAEEPDPINPGTITPAPNPLVFAAGTGPGDVQVLTLTPNEAPVGQNLILNVDGAGLGANGTIQSGNTVIFPVGSLAPQSVVVSRDLAPTQSGSGFISITQAPGAAPANYPAGSVNLSVLANFEAQEIPPLAIDPIAPTNFEVGTFGQTPPLNITGGLAPFTITLVSPSETVLNTTFGLSFDPGTGIISGIPTTATTGLNVSIRVTDSDNPPASATANFTLVIENPPPPPAP